MTQPTHDTRTATADTAGTCSVRTSDEAGDTNRSQQMLMHEDLARAQLRARVREAERLRPAERQARSAAAARRARRARARAERAGARARVALARLL